MKRLYILCEGQTEEDFVSIVLNPYLHNMGVIAIPIICTTKRTPAKKYKGGVSNFAKIKKELQRLCGEHPNEKVTTIFDLYALSHDTPGLDNGLSDVYEKVEHIENAIINDIGDKFNSMVFNLTLHEFKGLLFYDVSAFEIITDDEAIVVSRVRKKLPIAVCSGRVGSCKTTSFKSMLFR